MEDRATHARADRDESGGCRCPLAWGDVDEQAEPVPYQARQDGIGPPVGCCTRLADARDRGNVPGGGPHPYRRVFPGFTPDVAKNVMARMQDGWDRAPAPARPPSQDASVKIAEGVPVTQVAAQLGHSRKSLTLDTYSHVSIDDEETLCEGPACGNVTRGRAGDGRDASCDTCTGDDGRIGLAPPNRRGGHPRPLHSSGRSYEHSPDRHRHPSLSHRRSGRGARRAARPHRRDALALRSWSPTGRRACSWRRCRSSPVTGRPSTTGARPRRS